MASTSRSASWIAWPLAPIQYLASGARRFGAHVGRAAQPADFASVRLDPMLGKAIAAAYVAAPQQDERAYPSYAAFSRETVQQFHFLVGRVEFGGLGVTVRFVDDDPYNDVSSLFEDLRRRRLAVYASAASGNPHPYLSDAENDMFRAVHDVFGHTVSGRGFDLDGEEAAWRSHLRMYSVTARGAMTTETRGQNCALAFGCDNGRFPEQKAVLLPTQFWAPTEHSVMGTRSPGALR